MKHYSRSHWAQIAKRIRKAQFVFTEKWKCFICGIAFNSAVCTHSREENEEVLAKAKVDAGVAN
jgi:hypothetical protein